MTMTDSPDLHKLIGDMGPGTVILSRSQFVAADLLAAAEITAGQLKGILDRQLVYVRDQNPGTGKRRMFSGEEMLRIAVAARMSAIGFPMQHSQTIADLVYRRADARLSGVDLNAGRGELSLASYEQKDGQWAYAPIWSKQPRPPLPVAYQVLEVDRMIDQVVAKLVAVINDQPVPLFEIPAAPTLDPYSPDCDFFRMWAKDGKGRDVLIGLTFDETRELQELQRANLDDTARGDPDRYLELNERHESARQKRLDEDRERAVAQNPSVPASLGDVFREVIKRPSKRRAKK